MPQVTRIDPQAHVLTRNMLAALARAQPVETRCEGGWVLPVGDMPEVDRARPSAKYWGTIAEQLYGYAPPVGGRLQCTNYFPSGGGMEWHTDSGMTGWRVYVFRCIGDGSSTFRYRDQTFIEGAVGAYVFETGVGCWHAVESHRDRFSCGVQIYETLARELAETAAVC